MKDRTAVNHKIRKHFNELIYNVARYTEVVLSIVILVVIALAGLRLILTTAGTSIMDMDTSFFTSFLSQALSLVVGVEFVKMLCRHSAQTVVEVLLFATARNMVSTSENPNLPKILPPTVARLRNWTPTIWRTDSRTAPSV